MTDWNQVANDAIAAATGVLDEDWPIVSAGATAQIKTLISVAADAETSAEETPPGITPDEYASLKLSQQRALEGILTTYKAIGIVVAEQAAAAVWNVVETAFSAAAKAAIGL
jgi:hypothetical protein